MADENNFKSPIDASTGLLEPRGLQGQLYDNLKESKNELEDAIKSGKSVLKTNILRTRKNIKSICNNAKGLISKQFRRFRVNEFNESQIEAMTYSRQIKDVVEKAMRVCAGSERARKECVKFKKVLMANTKPVKLLDEHNNDEVIIGGLRLGCIDANIESLAKTLCEAMVDAKFSVQCDVGKLVDVVQKSHEEKICKLEGGLTEESVVVNKFKNENEYLEFLILEVIDFYTKNKSAILARRKKMQKDAKENIVEINDNGQGLSRRNQSAEMNESTYVTMTKDEQLMQRMFNLLPSETQALTQGVMPFYGITNTSEKSKNDDANNVFNENE